MENCLFCRIFEKKIPSTIHYESKNVLAFQDLHPVAPTHLLFIHKNHSKDALEMVEKNPQDILDIFEAIRLWREQQKTQDKTNSQSFRLLTNVGELAGQSVFHTHFHLVGGKKLSWPGI